MALEWLEGLLKLVDEGKVRHLGVSLPDIRPATGVLLAKSRLVVAQQVIFDILKQEPAIEHFRHGEKKSTAFIARVSFDSGVLTGTWTDDTYAERAPDDKRRHMHRGDRFAATLARVARIQSTCSRYHSTLAEAAMKYSLRDPAVSAVACGMRNRTEVDLNTGYSDGTAFPDELREALRPSAWTHQFY